MFKRVVLGFLSLLFCVGALAQPTPGPELKEFTQKVLSPFFSPIKDNVKITIETQTSGESTLVLRTFTPEAPGVKAMVYSEYRFHFYQSETANTEVPQVQINRWRDRDGNFINPQIKGEMNVAYQDGKLSEREKLGDQVRSLFRADFTLHPIHANPLIGKTEKSLTPAQKEVLLGKTTGEFKQPGLYQLYIDHLTSQSEKPAWMAAILPTGIGKTFVALKFWQAMQEKAPGAKMVFIVENTAILRDVVPKIQEVAPKAKTLRLFGAGASAAIDGSFDVLLATRSTYYKRMAEIHEILERSGVPVTMIRDEAHHTGKEAGQLEKTLKDFMARMSKTSQVIDLTATMWHFEMPDMIKRYAGKVATAFLEPGEYKQLVEGVRVDTLARIQLMRAFFSGWLAPLESMTFITEIENVEKEGREIRERLLVEQKSLVERFGLSSDGALEFRIGDIPVEQLSALRSEIERVHGPIVDVILTDLKAQFSRDANGRVAQYDRGLIFVPTIIHAEIYVRLLQMGTQGENMEFRMVHSRMPRTAKNDPVTENFDWLNDGEKPQRKHKYLINVGMAKEGVDIPTLNRIVFATVTENIKVLIQVLGRGLRLSSLKTGVRLTDLTGSYERFFRGLPEKMLSRFFSAEGMPGSSDWGIRNRFMKDGKAMSWGEFLKFRVADVGEALTETHEKDLAKANIDTEERERLAKLAEAREEASRIKAENLDKDQRETFEKLDLIEERFGWSRRTLEVSRKQVNRAVETILALDGGERVWDLSVEGKAFIRTHWRFLSMTWADFLTDMVMSDLLSKEHKEYLEKILKRSVKHDRIALSMKNKVYNRIYHAIYDSTWAGTMNILPEEYFRLGRTIKGAEAKKYLEAYLLIQTLSSTDHGRKMLAQSPQISKALEVMDRFFEMQAEIAYNMKKVDPGRDHLKGPKGADYTHHDFRWIQILKFSSELISNLSANPTLAKLRTLGISQGLPSDIGGMPRDPGSAIRMSKLAYPGKGAGVFSYYFGRFLGGPHLAHGHAEKNDFRFRFLEEIKNRWSGMAAFLIEVEDEFRRGVKYSQNFFAAEDTLWRQALIVEISKEQGKEAVAEMRLRGEVFANTWQVIEGVPMTEFTFEELMKSMDFEMLRGTQAEMTSRLNYLVSREANLLSIPFRDGRAKGESFTTNTLDWFDSVYRLVNIEALKSPVSKDSRMIGFLEALSGGFERAPENLPRVEASSLEWLLDPVPKSVLYGVQWKSIFGSEMNKNIFGEPRVFHLLRYYIAIENDFVIEKINGLGEVSGQRVRKAAVWLKTNYGEQLKVLEIKENFSKESVESLFGRGVHPYWASLYRAVLYNHFVGLLGQMARHQEASKGNEGGGRKAPNRGPLDRRSGYASDLLKRTLFPDSTGSGSPDGRGSGSGFRCIHVFAK